MIQETRHGPRGPRTRRRARRGTSLVELLVVIVVLLVGILAVVRIFPGGFHVLATARNQALAQQLARQLLERVSAAPDGIPEQIVPVTYTPVSGAVRVDSAAYRIPGDTAPPGDGVDSKGMVLQNGTEVGYWPYVSGANILRRIVNEGHRVPAPRAVGSDFGGLLMLTFAPVLTDTDDYVSAIVYQPAFDVVGADMALLQGTPSGGVEREYQYYADKVSGPTATLYLPRATAPNGVSPRTYRVSFTAWVQKTVTLVVRREVAGTVTIDSDPAGGYVAAGESFTDTNHNGVWDTGEPFVDADGNGQYDAGIAANPSNLVQLAAGEVLDSLELDSIRVARQFAQVTSFTPGEPYEYKRINWKLGQLLFNPAGYNYYESRQEGRVPLVARVTYDVFDWRILHEDFRIPSSSPLQLRLSVPSLRPKNAVLPDSQLNGGLNVPLPTFDTTASTVVLENRDFALIDRETGGIFLPTSYNVDYTQGSITFVDNDANPANGLQMGVILPGATSPTAIDAGGRAVTALYMANGDWSVQPMKSADAYLASVVKPNAAEYFIKLPPPAGPNPDPVEVQRRIYFPWADLNQRVRVGVAWYHDVNGNLKQLRDQDFLITSSKTDVIGQPFVDLIDADPNAVGLTDLEYGYALKNVEGLSISSRTFWNTGYFTLSNDPTENLKRLIRYRQGTHASAMETSILRRSP